MNINNVYNCQKNRLIQFILTYSRNHKSIWNFLSLHCPISFSKLFYYATYQKLPNLRQPRDFNEKLMKLKLNEYKTNQQIADYADKYIVRLRLEKMGHGDLLTKLYGVYEFPDQIDYEILPNRFVIKMNHGSGYNIICKDKNQFNKVKAHELLSVWGKEDYGIQNGEWHYSNIKPLITIEEYIDALGNDEMLIDYKFNCFKGKVHSIFLCYDRTPSSVKFDLYTTDWQRTDFIKPEFRPNRRLLDRPKNLDKMIKIAEDISKNFKYVRVDLYDIESRVYFGECTFSPHSCTLEYYEQVFLDEMGKELNL